MSYLCDRCGAKMYGKPVKILAILNHPEESPVIKAMNEMGMCSDCEKELLNRIEGFLMYRPKGADEIDENAVLHLYHDGWNSQKIAIHMKTDKKVIEDIITTKG